MQIMDKIFENRKEFAIIGLTGRTVCGCTTCGQILARDFSKLDLEPSVESGPLCNEDRKNRIIYDYAKAEWRPYFYLKISDVITSFGCSLNSMHDICLTFANPSGKKYIGLSTS